MIVGGDFGTRYQPIAMMNEGTGELIDDGAFSTVDKFVAEKASNFNKVQQSSTSRPQSIQQQSLRLTQGTTMIFVKQSIA